LFSANQPLAINFASRWGKHYGLDFGEARQVALIELWRAAEAYDPSRGFKFSTLASTYIKHALIKMAGRRKPMPTVTDVSSDQYAPRQAVAPTTTDVVDVKDFIGLGLTVLTDRERLVIEARFTDGLTLDETGQRVGLTRERIRQIEQKALEKMRAKLGVND
jgi:RNA polymerase primary sigma factor